MIQTINFLNENKRSFPVENLSCYVIQNACVCNTTVKNISYSKMYTGKIQNFIENFNSNSIFRV